MVTVLRLFLTFNTGCRRFHLLAVFLTTPAIKNDASHIDLECPVWREFRKGDPDALATIFHQHYDSLYFYGKKLARDEELAKDCVQNLFLKIWASRERLMPVKNVRPYLLKALRRHIGDHVVSVNRKKAFEQQLAPEFQITFSHEDFLIASQITREKGESLARAINALSTRQREAVFLKFYEGLDYKRIAEVMSLNLQSVRNLIHQALRSIKGQISVNTPVLLNLESDER